MFRNKEINLLKKSINDLELALSFEKDTNRLLLKELKKMRGE